MALAAKIGRLQAHDLVESACRQAVEEGRHLKDVLASEPEVAAHLPAADLDRLFDPLNYVGEAIGLVDQMLAARVRP